MNRILIGDVLDGLAQLPDGCVQTCVTSPPYYGLRDYGTAAWVGGNPACDHLLKHSAAGVKDSPARQSTNSSKSERLNRSECRCGATRVDSQIGLEPTPDQFIARLVAVFREVRRVLRPDGTIWVNMGDSYAGSRSGPDTNSPLLSKRNNHSQARSAQKLIASRRRDNAEIPRSDITFPGYKPKDMMGMPWMLAFALRADGWYLRQDIIWHKPNPMPESVTDRCTKAHEYVFLLSKSERYFYDAEAVKEPASPNTHARMARGAVGSHMPHGWAQGDQPHDAAAFSAVRTNGVGFGHGYDKTTKSRVRKLAANGSFDEAVRGHVDARNKRSVWTINTQAYKEAHFATFPEKLVEPCILAGSRPGDMVLDPFMGSGTVACVATRLGRQYVGCELNPDYAAMAERRIRGTHPGLALQESSGKVTGRPAKHSQVIDCGAAAQTRTGDLLITNQPAKAADSVTNQLHMPECASSQVDG